MILLISILCFLIAVLTYILFMPIFFEINYDIDNRTVQKGVIRIYPFKFSFKIGGEKKAADADKTVAAGKKKVKRKKKMQGLKIDFMRLLREEYMMLKQIGVEAMRLAAGIIKTPDYHLNVSLNGGFASPDLTGCLYGGVCAVRSMPVKAINIEYNPDFNVERLGGEVTGRVVVRISTIIKELLLFAWRLPKLKILKTYFRIKRRRNG